jgi:cyclic beta-1,2-glucan synthetase
MSLLRRLRTRRRAAAPWNSDELIRAELFGIERLEEHATSLAVAQQVTSRTAARHSLGARLRDNEIILLSAYRGIAASVGDGRLITPAAEWLLDNYHVVEEQIREIRQDLPPSYYRLLPKLAGGPLRGYPRVFGLAWAFVAHTDSRFDPEALRRFVRAYQQVQPLSIGELWAVAITLRIVLVENLRRAASRIIGNRDARAEADAIADQLLGVDGAAGEPEALARLAPEGSDFAPAFVVQLVLRLRDQDPRVTPAVQWLERRLSLQGQSSEQLVHDEHQKQGASNVTVRNIITSMRLLSDLDWPEFFESVSLVDERLRAGSDFAAMDFASRNLYRSAIEELARGSACSEPQIAEAALAACLAAHAGREADPGFHLIGAGRAAFAATLGYRRSLLARSRHFSVAHGARRYLASIALLSALLLCLPLYALHVHGVSAAPLLLLMAVLGVFPAFDMAVCLVNRAVTRGFGATILPALALRQGVSEPMRTLIVVPILLSTRAAIDTQVERLEVHYLSSPDGELYFALLSDWTDAAQASLPGDDALLAAAVAGIAALNRKYAGGAAGERFYLLHRRRVWSAGQKLWMGWERKRGKLHELNRLLRAAPDTSFIDLAGQRPRVPARVRYVITLDADTRLPRDAARRLIGKMAHPLNRPRFDARSGRVLDGYAVLQPRVAPSLPLGREGSRFQRVLSSTGGIDPYAAAASDVYQDLFGEGSYAGKGIYDVDAFESALAGRVVDDALLSHDLFEGLYARAGLVSDIQVVEEFPARYEVAAARQHRWVRGDWQLLPWILGRRDAALATGTRGGERLTLIGRWKMLDNLRRSLGAPACLLALAVGWLLPPGAALEWTLFVLMSVTLPAWLPVFASVLPQRAGITVRSHLYALRQDLRLAGGQSAFLLAFLADQAWLMSDAIVRTLFRLIISQRNLLQWVTAAQSGSSARLGIPHAYRRMLGGVLVAAGVGVLVVARAPASLWLAGPLVLLWVAAPTLAVWISRAPPVARLLVIAPDDQRLLRQVGRRTWRYFERFVTAAEHWLPPDNFQEEPRPVIASRTSPTNIGLYLLATVSAREFGWIGTLDTVERLEATLATLRRLQRYRGHLYNWYDTRDLRPLEPRYVSTVDSGNLAAHLLALANACHAWGEASAPPVDAIPGARDAVALASEALAAIPAALRTQTVARHHLAEALRQLDTLLARGHAPAIALAAATMLDIARGLASELDGSAGADMLYWAEAAQRSLVSALRDPSQPGTAEPEAERSTLVQRLAAVEADARQLAMDMEFGFLLDAERRLLSIGYRANEGVLDNNCYDLLASEARLASFVAIAKNDVPAQHWFRLGRPVTPIGNGAALISWSGSMFEYLMPSLVLRAPAGSLLEQTNRLIVRRQQDYGAERHVPWGISESAYNARDLELTYQYSNFGVPGLGLKRGLSESTVVAPYATALAAMVDPAAAVANFARLAAVGALGRYGYYEALDYTRTRVPDGASCAVVCAFMAHHQGMTLVAIANVLFNGRLREHFHAEAMVQATELLLQERTPRDVSVTHPRAEEVASAARLDDTLLPAVRRLHTPHDATPQTHLLSNGRYALMLTAAGSGYSRWGDLALTRWREDLTRDDHGSYFFLRDVESGLVWSAGFQPSALEPQRYEVTFTEDRGEIVRVDDTMTTTLEVLVSPEDDAEVRRVSLSNGGSRPCDIDVTSYAELVLATPAADLAHPAFSKLFVQTEYLEKSGALLATRRRRSPEEAEVWVAQLAVVEGESLQPPEYETDRARFIGRGRELRDAIAIHDGRRLSNTVGTVLDAVFALRHRVRVPAGGTVRIATWTCVAATRAALLLLLDKHQESNAFVRAGTLAWTQAQVQLRHLGIDAAEANLFQRLAGHVLYANAAMRPSSATISRGAAGPDALWAQGISGDLPIVLLRIDSIDDIEIARQLLRAQEYWRLKQLAIDVVLLNERAASYVQDLHNALETQLRMSQSRPRLGGDHMRGGVHVLRSDLISQQTRTLLYAVARVVLSAQRGSLADQLDRHREPPEEAALVPYPLAADEVALTPALPADLEFYNGLGGFTDGGREYFTLLGPGQSTPAPWINVIANAQFGFQVATEGSGFTWSLNSREHQLSPWSNDPVCDRPGEVLYLRDEETGELWGPTAAPIREAHATYAIRHGQGYSRFEHHSHGIALELLVYVPLADPIKISRLKIRNTTSQTRRLSVTAYVECVLGATRSATAPHIVTELDAVSGALLMRNPWGNMASGRVAFADLGGLQDAWTCDRREFLGRHGTLARPAALAGLASLRQRAGAGLDPCCALQTAMELAAGEEREVVFVLGDARGLEEAQALIAKYRSADLDGVLQQVVSHWDELLGAVQVATPDRALDIMLNRWLPYQTLSARVWGRTGFYQASGAYGFRDQLQDGMALVYARPDLTREHLLRAASRQFHQGDVQHWWLPHNGLGVRTRISDDRVWLAHAAARYAGLSGDAAVFDEPVLFLEGQVLAPGEHEACFQPVVSDDVASLYEHCARALDQSLETGAHGLPLIGTGDWNDGMNRVGEQGRGESVWLGWFLCTTLRQFAPWARTRGESARAARWLQHAQDLGVALESAGWDGQWYRRAYYDDGASLGVSADAECRIDSIAQSWAVLSGVADPERARLAMAAVDSELIRRDLNMALLFTPPFEHSSQDPGYIKGYPPGLRENGGQYTHGALWSVMAFAALGQGDRAAEVLSMLNPIRRTSTRADVHRYKVEPYVVAADVYSVAPHAGRGGWTWYTGSASWMYRAGLESLLGLRLQGTTLHLAPCLPAHWPGAQLQFRYRSARYDIALENQGGAGSGVLAIVVDGVALASVATGIALLDDATVHHVQVRMGH